MNYEPTSRLHDPLPGRDVERDRQTIQRRQARLRSRIDSMNELERHELLQWMQENYGTAPLSGLMSRPLLHSLKHSGAFGDLYASLFR